MTKENLENILDEKTRIEAIIRKFLPNRLDISDQYVDENGQIETLALSEFDEPQRAMAYGFLADHYIQNALEFENAARGQIDGTNTIELPPEPVFSRPKVEHPDVGDLCSIGYPWYKFEAPIFNFIGALSYYVDSLRCLREISPEFRLDSWGQILSNARGINKLGIPDEGIERTFPNSTKLYYPRRFMEQIEKTALELQSSKYQEAKPPKLRDAAYFKALDETKRKYLLSADSIALSDDWESESFDACRFWDTQILINRSRTAMAFMYQQAGENNLAKVIDKFEGGEISCFTRKDYCPIRKVSNVTQNGSNFCISYQPRNLKFGIGSNGVNNFSEEERVEDEQCRFREALSKLKIKHILTRIKHPQSNGKSEKFGHLYKLHRSAFNTKEEFINWYNNIRPHMSLDERTPEEVYQERKKIGRLYYT